MFLIYNLLLTLLAPIWAPWMWLRARKREEPPNWRERFGDYDFGANRNTNRVWIHAVSVGEVIAARPVLKDLRSELPGYEIVLSVTTSSGHRTARESPAGLYDHLVYFPIDVVRFQLAAMTRVRPAAVAVMETELWMNFLWAARTMGARTLLINGRISDKAFRLDRKVGFYFKALFKFLDRILAQSEEDRAKLVALGAAGVEVFGNAKFDQALEGVETDPAKWRRELSIPEGRSVLVIGSTRGEDEEALVIEAVKRVGLGNLTVIHAPRHLERVEQLSESVEHAFGQVARRSLGQTGDYVVLDTYGELASLYCVADLVVIGGGFGDYGGQNILQPLAHGKPVLHGPHMQNFKDVSAAALAAGASKVCGDASELADAITQILANAPLRSKMGRAAAELIKLSAGASRRYAKAIAEEARRAVK